MCNIGAKIITILAPIIAEVKAPTPMIIFSAVVGLGIVAASFIKTQP